MRYENLAKVYDQLSSTTKRLEKINTHISSLTVDNFFRKPHSLIKTLLAEGISILTNKPFVQNFGFLSYAIYSYDLSQSKASEKVKFVYLLKGRKGEGIVKRFKGEWIANSCFIIPINKDSEMLAVFKKWSDVRYKKREVLIH